MERCDEVNGRVVEIAERRRLHWCKERNAVAHAPVARKTIHNEDSAVKSASFLSQGYDPSSKKGFVGTFAINIPA